MQVVRRITFKIIEHTPDRTLVRYGDFPPKTDVRDSDGMFKLSAHVNKDEGIEKFRLKSVFFQGLERLIKSPCRVARRGPIYSIQSNRW